MSWRQSWIGRRCFWSRKRGLRPLSMLSCWPWSLWWPSARLLRWAPRWARPSRTSRALSKTVGGVTPAVSPRWKAGRYNRPNEGMGLGHNGQGPSFCMGGPAAPRWPRKFFLNRPITFPEAAGGKRRSQLARFTGLCSLRLSINWTVSDACTCCFPRRGGCTSSIPSGGSWRRRLTAFCSGNTWPSKCRLRAPTGNPFL